MQDETPRPGRPLEREQRTVSGHYFDLMCLLAHTTQEEVARSLKISSSQFSRTFSGKQRMARRRLLAAGDVLFARCPTEHHTLLRELEERMLHAMGFATRTEEEQAREELGDYAQRVETATQSDGGRPRPDISKT